MVPGRLESMPRRRFHRHIRQAAEHFRQRPSGIVEFGSDLYGAGLAYLRVGDPRDTAFEGLARP